MSAKRNVSQSDIEAEPFRWAPRRVVSKAELLKMYSPTERDDGALTIEKTEKPMSEFKTRSTGAGKRVLVHTGSRTFASLYTDKFHELEVERDTAAARLAAIAAGKAMAHELPAEPWMDQIEASKAWAEAMSKTDIARGVALELREWEAARRRMCLAVFGEVKAWKHEAEELLRRDERAGTALRMGELPTMAPSEPESSPLARVMGCGHEENSGTCPNCAKEWKAEAESWMRFSMRNAMAAESDTLPLSMGWNCDTEKHTAGETPERILSQRNYDAGTLDVYDHSGTLVLRAEGLPSDGPEQPLEDAVRAALCAEVLRLRAIISGPPLQRGAQVVCQDDEDP